MSRSYEDFEEEYSIKIGKIRRILVASRTVASLNEAEKCLADAKNCAHAMQGLSEVAGDLLKIQNAKRRLFQELGPLSKEIARSVNQLKNNASRETLFQSGSTNNSVNQKNSQTANDYNNDTNQLLSESERLLLESQSLCADSELTGTRTLGQMGVQREQLQIARYHIDETMNITRKAGVILNEMRHRAARNKNFLYFVIGVLIILNGLALRHLFKK